MRERGEEAKAETGQEWGEDEEETGRMRDREGIVDTRWGYGEKER